MIDYYPQKLDRLESIAEIFELVKQAVRRTRKRSRAGLMLAIADLGNQPGAFFGAFYPVASNLIVMNKVPLLRIRDTQPELYNSYVFHVLLHEYLHTLGWMPEEIVRPLAHQISVELFGDDHPTTQIARDPKPFFGNLVYPDMKWQPKSLQYEMIEDFDKSSYDSYIA